MATYQTRNGRTRAIVRRKGFSPKSRTFPTKTAAKTWADRVERELAALEAKGVPEGAELTVAEIVDWYLSYLRELKKPISATQTGNLSRIKEGLGSKLASKLIAADIIEHTKTRRTGHRPTRCAAGSEDRAAPNRAG